MTAYPALRRAAFTLVELLLVIVLILTLIGLSMPLFKNTFSDLTARNAALNISKLVNYAQEMSILNRNNFKIVFNFDKGFYQLFELNTQISPAVYSNTAGRFGRLFSVPRPLKLNGNTKEMVFYPDGHCDELKLSVLGKTAGYSVLVKRFGNMVEIKEATVER